MNKASYAVDLIRLYATIKKISCKIKRIEIENKDLLIIETDDTKEISKFIKLIEDDIDTIIIDSRYDFPFIAD